MIKLTQVYELISGGHFHRTVHVNARHIQYYHADILQIPCEPDIEVTRVVTLSFDDLTVTETPDEIDIKISGYRPGR